MTIPIKLYDPLYQLKPIAENVWIVDGPAIETDRAAATIEQFNEVTLNVGAGVAAAAINLTDHNTG